jgi:uncharacterized protein YneF (UPF0154 family)
MKKILYIIVILVVLGLIFFMFPGVYLKYSITNKLPKEKNSRCLLHNFGRLQIPPNPA